MEERDMPSRMVFHVSWSSSYGMKWTGSHGWQEALGCESEIDLRMYRLKKPGRGRGEGKGRREDGRREERRGRRGNEWLATDGVWRASLLFPTVVKQGRSGNRCKRGVSESDGECRRASLGCYSRMTGASLVLTSDQAHNG